MPTIKTISLTQPYASLIAAGAKTTETRSWTTAYRGPLAIHAAKGMPKECVALSYTSPFRELLALAGYVDVYSQYRHQALERGAVIAICELVACRRTEHVRDLLSEQEQAFGNYADGRWAWELADVRRLPQPIPARGFLGLWSWEQPA